MILEPPITREVIQQRPLGIEQLSLLAFPPGTLGIERVRHGLGYSTLPLLGLRFMDLLVSVLPNQVGKGLGFLAVLQVYRLIIGLLHYLLGNEELVLLKGLLLGVVHFTGEVTAEGGLI